MKVIRLLLAVPLLFFFVAVTDARILQQDFLASLGGACGASSEVQPAAFPGGLTPEPVNAAALATCSVNCPNGTTLSCTVTTCSAQNCGPGGTSYIVCNGVTQSCSTACGSQCTPGAERWVPDGCCTPNKGRTRKQVCSQFRYWTSTATTTCYGNCVPNP